MTILSKQEENLVAAAEASPDVAFQCLAATVRRLDKMVGLVWTGQHQAQEQLNSTRARLSRVLRRLADAWVAAESNRGCYSTTSAHDSRCERRWKGSRVCTCGRDEIEAAEAEARSVLASMGDH